MNEIQMSFVSSKRCMYDYIFSMLQISIATVFISMKTLLHTLKVQIYKLRQKDILIDNIFLITFDVF